MSAGSRWPSQMINEKIPGSPKLPGIMILVSLFE